MIFSALFAWISGGWLPTKFVLENRKELVNIFIIYRPGYAALMLMFVFLNHHALRVADQLLLNRLEKVKTSTDIASFLVLAVTDLVPAGFAWIMPTSIGIFAGFIYISLPIIVPFVGIFCGKKLKKLDSTY